MFTFVKKYVIIRYSNQGGVIWVSTGIYLQRDGKTNVCIVAKQTKGW